MIGDSLPIPGKILIVDDKFDTVKDAASQLLNKGLPVLYWDGKDAPPTSVQNIRAVVLDLNLTGMEMRGPGYYAPAAESLHKIPGPFVTVIMSQDFSAGDPEELRKAYKEYYNDIPPVIIHDKGLAKSELDDPKKLTELLAESLKTREIMSLVLLWESILDGSKDAVLQDFVEARLETAVLRLVQTIHEEQGEHGTPRQFVETLMRLLSRTMVSSKELEKLAESLSKVLNMQHAATSSGDMDNLLHWLLMYYCPDENEKARTGDIYQILGGKDYLYGIVLTPICDLVQEKTQTILVCKGYELGDKCFNDPDSPLLTCDPEMVRKKAKVSDPPTLAQSLKKKYLENVGGGIPQGLHCLWNSERESANRATQDYVSTLGMCKRISWRNSTTA